VITRLFAEERSDFTGRHYVLHAAPSLPRPLQHPRPPIHVGGAGERRTLPLVARHADVWNCPTYALGALEQKLAVLRGACASIGRDPATLGVSEEAVLALVERRDQVDAARSLAARRFPGPGWGFDAGGYCGTPDDVVARLRERAALGVRSVVFFLHDRAEPATLALLAHEVAPRVAAL
jgi:alkanesulfonate monooxygenase SsuD/methylene tetrahydromethanopterin reductase-like flavin-dependent oxidoreductase (luciferase family)